MLFKAELTIPASTTFENYVQTSVKLLPGRLIEVDVRFPPGCSGLASVAIYEKEHQLFPNIWGEGISGDTFPVNWTEDYEVTQAPYIFDVRGWNADTLYPHTVTLYFALLASNEVWQQWFRQLIGIG